MSIAEALAAYAFNAPVASPKATPKPSASPAEIRRKRGLIIAALCPIRPEGKDNRYRVPSQNGGGSYLVQIDRKKGPDWRCDCKDFETRELPCKHIFAVQHVIDRQKNPTQEPETPSGKRTYLYEHQKKAKAAQASAKRPTYKQDWPAYNAAQIHEKARFQELLVELCKGVQEPARPHGGAKGGRPPLPMADRAFACAFKVYTTISGRRASTDMRDSTDKGHLSKSPHYSAVARYLEDPAMTPILKDLIIESSRPLASVERDFAGDSSGFTTCRFESWYDHKYGIIRRQHGWVKMHIMTGVTTNIITAVEIRGKDACDTPLLPPLLDTTAKTFTMREVSADKIYASHDNYAEIEKHGATPYIPFKARYTGAAGGLWGKMWHFYNFNRDEFLAHYHKRSNVESTFSMMKAKFGDSVRSKTDTAMVNEALCKVLCHNVVVLIQSACELGIEARFWRDEPAAMTAADIEMINDDMQTWDWV